MKIPRDWTTGLAILAAVIAVVVQRCEDTPRPEPPREECPPCEARVGLLAEDVSNPSNMRSCVVKDCQVYDELPPPGAHIKTTTTADHRSPPMSYKDSRTVVAATILACLALLVVLLFWMKP